MLKMENCNISEIVLLLWVTRLIKVKAFVTKSKYRRTTQLFLITVSAVWFCKI